MELRHRGIRLEVDRYAAMRDGKILELTAEEFSALELLMQDPGASVPMDALRKKATASGMSEAGARILIAGLAGKLGHPSAICCNDDACYLL